MQIYSQMKLPGNLMNATIDSWGRWTNNDMCANITDASLIFVSFTVAVAWS